MKNNNLSNTEDKAILSNIDYRTNNINHLKSSINKIRTLSNILKEKNNLTDTLLINTKKQKKTLLQELSNKENELIKLDNEINVLYSKLYSQFPPSYNKIISKLKLIRNELFNNKTKEYLNKKILIEEKEKNLKKKFSKLSTEQLQQFNNEYHSNNIEENKIVEKQYEDIKKSNIYNNIFKEIKIYLNNDNPNNLSDSNKKFNSKLMNNSSYSLNSVNSSILNSNLFTNKSKKGKVNRSVDYTDKQKNTQINNRNGVENNNNNSIKSMNVNNNRISSKKIRSKFFLSNETI